MKEKKQPIPLTWEIEGTYPDDIICGVDEVGRGPLCGDVYAAACILQIGRAHV